MNVGPEGESCETCYFFVRQSTWNEKNKSGNCKRFPPEAYKTYRSLSIPIEDCENEWCGEYKHKINSTLEGDYGYAWTY